MQPPPLSPDAKKQIRRLRASWQKIICSTDRLERTTTSQAFIAAYRWFDRQPPEIIFVDSPQAAIELLLPLATPQIFSTRSASIFRLIWHWLWFLPALIWNYFISGVLCFGLVFLLGVVVAVGYKIMAWLMPLLPPLSESQLFIDIYAGLVATAAVVALLLALLWIETTLAAIDKQGLAMLDRYGGRWLDLRFRARFGYPIHDDFNQKLWQPSDRTWSGRFTDDLVTFYSPKLKVYVKTLWNISRQAERAISPHTTLNRDFPNSYHRGLLLPNHSWFDRENYLREVSNWDFELAKLPDLAEFNDWWQVYRAIAANCHLFIPYSKVCIICDRPTQMQIDNNGTIHAVGRPAWGYADGSAWYFYRGLELPPIYGAIPPTEWRSDSIVFEDDPKIRQLLIREIGYERLCRELNATPLDTWSEYTLLSIAFCSNTPPQISWIRPQILLPNLHVLRRDLPLQQPQFFEVPLEIVHVQSAVDWLIAGGLI